MNKEIYDLDTTIKKRLGIKANRLWDKTKQDLILVDLIRNHITKNVRHEINTQDLCAIKLDVYYDYISSQLNDFDREFLLNWLKANIDKEKLKEWLENDK